MTLGWTSWADVEGMDELDLDEWFFDKAQIPTRFRRCLLETSPLPAAAVDIFRAPLRPANDASEEVWDTYHEKHRVWAGSWYLCGPVGVGKTGLAVGYGVERWHSLPIKTRQRMVFEDTAPCLFVPAPDMLTQLRSTYHKDAALSEAHVIKAYTDPALLIVDDLGAEKISGAEWVQDRLFQIIGHRHAWEKSTVITSNYNLEETASRIGERLAWRIKEMCGESNILQVRGENLRARPQFRVLKGGA